MSSISIASPIIGEQEKKAVMDVLDSGHLVQGDRVEAFEKAFAEFCNVRFAIATTNGTTALSTALLASGIQRGDEVIVPSFSFVATATSVLSVNALPVFVDIEPETFCLDPELVEAAITEKTRAIMPVHLYGHPADMQPIKQIADKYGLAIIEDAAQAHGAKIDNEIIGGWGIAAFSFYPSKNMTTGEGGMVTTNDPELANLARMVRNHGMSQQYLHETIGFNYRMTNIMAAIGLVQLEHLSAWNKIRNDNAAYFDSILKTVRAPVVRKGCYHVYHQYTVVVPEGANRDAMVTELNNRGIGCRVYYPLPIHCQPIFRNQRPDGNHCHCGYKKQCLCLPVTKTMADRVFSLPVHPSLSQEDLERIGHEVNSL